MTALLLTIRFILELALLTALGVAGWNLVDGTGGQLALAVTLPLVAALVWGLLLSPKARLDAPLPVRVAIELALFVVASVLLWSVELTTFAVVLVVTEVVILVALISTGTPPGADVDLRRRPHTE